MLSFASPQIIKDFSQGLVGRWVGGWIDGWMGRKIDR